MYNCSTDPNVGPCCLASEMITCFFFSFRFQWCRLKLQFVEFINKEIVSVSLKLYFFCFLKSMLHLCYFLNFVSCRESHLLENVDYIAVNYEFFLLKKKYRDENKITYNLQKFYFFILWMKYAHCSYRPIYTWTKMQWMPNGLKKFFPF